MATETQRDWKDEFGIADRHAPQFFSSVDQLDDTAGKAPQPHALRRAFEQMRIDGVLCRERAGTDEGLQPIIYFRQVERIDSAEIKTIHHSFWNQGVAPVLVVIAPDEVHVYSGLVPPSAASTETDRFPGFVESLKRVESRLRSFLLSVESGEYFHTHRKSFDPSRRVDRDLLDNLQKAREKLSQVPAARLEPQVLDALLCRLVFTCYLFDRGVIDRGYLDAHGIRDAEHLKDILAKKPKADAKTDLYKLFGQLGADFNGDLFSSDLEAESRRVRVEHLEILDKFFHGTDVQSGQKPFWPYNFGIIPIETISAIYEHFLKAAGEKQKKEAGAFYTPRFLAEFVLDVALQGETSLLDKRFLDPACGSGIFLVGLFNRLAEEWKQKNPRARYDHRARGLMDVLRDNLHGVDRNPTACQITAFSLYLAFLDQLSPPDIRKLLGKYRLPHLVGETIRHADFFTDAANPSKKINIVVGNPPWGRAKESAPTAARWCAAKGLPHPNRQMAAAFIWKAPSHLEDGGKVCFVLPHGTLFNHNDTAIQFQQSFFRAHAVERVVNLADYQYFLFEQSRAPALVMRYRKEKPADSAHRIDYWTPKADWSIIQAEIVTISPQDRTRFTVGEVLDALRGDDSPLIWKARLWATPRDRQLLDRLLLMPRLRDIASQPSKSKRWVIAEGFQPLGENDDPTKAQTLNLPARLFIEAKTKKLNLFLLENDCSQLASRQIAVRGPSNKNTKIFEAPHVLVPKGMAKDFFHVVFADFDVSFQHALRGIHGPKSDRDLLIFLAAYLRSDIARFFLFHTSSNVGVSRAEVHVEELLRAPFPLPEETQNPKRCRAIVSEVAAAVTKASKEASRDRADREGIVRRTQKAVGKRIDEYFDIDDIERMLIADTAKIIIPSVRPSRHKPNVPTVIQSNSALRASYVSLLCDRLNGWAKNTYRVHGRAVADDSIGVGMVVLEKNKRGENPTQLDATDDELLQSLDELRKTAAKNQGTFELARGLKVFHKNLLYITKPLGQRFWTNTAALNDADEIAAAILARPDREGT